MGKRPFGEVLNVGCEVGSEITEVGEEVRGEEGVLCGRQDDVLGEKKRRRVNHQGHFFNFSRRRLTLSSGFFSSSSLTRLLTMPISSCTMAWYVHCESRGVTGSLRRSVDSPSGQYTMKTTCIRAARTYPR